MASKPLHPDWEIIVDTREQLPYFIHGFQPQESRAPVPFRRQKLETGDYSIVGYEDKIAIERKSLEDFWRSITWERKRFEAEMERLSKIQYPYVIVEKTLDTAAAPRSQGRQISGASVTGTIASWSLRYGIHFHFITNRAEAELFAYQILKQFTKQFIADQEQERSEDSLCQ